MPKKNDLVTRRKVAAAHHEVPIDPRTEVIEIGPTHGGGSCRPGAAVGRDVMAAFLQRFDQKF